MIKGILGKDIYSGTDDDPGNALVEMLHSCTPSANKEKILLSFQSINGTIQLLIASIAFGMGEDCKGVHRDTLWTCQNVESYIQETGRPGRDGTQSCVYILYHEILLAHIDGYMKRYVKKICSSILTALLGSTKFCICAVINVLQIVNAVCLIVEL